MTEGTTNDAPRVGLCTALAAAQERCKPVAKDGYNKHHSYAYASSEAIYAQSREAFDGTGLVLISTGSKVEMRETTMGPLTSKQHERGEHYDPTLRLPALWLVRAFDLVHVSGESKALTVEWPVVLEAGRTLDKALAGAMTSSLAYLLRDLLIMPRVAKSDDMNANERDAERAADEAYDAAEKAAAAAKDPKPKQTAKGRRSQDAGVHERPPARTNPTPPSNGAGSSPPQGAPPAPSATVPPRDVTPIDLAKPSPETVGSARRIGPAALEAIKGAPETVLSPDVAAALIAEVAARAKDGEAHPLVKSWRKKFATTLPTVAGARGIVGVIGLELDHAARVRIAADAEKAKAERARLDAEAASRPVISEPVHEDVKTPSANERVLAAMPERNVLGPRMDEDEPDDVCPTCGARDCICDDVRTGHIVGADDKDWRS